MSDTPRTDEQINGKPCTRFECLVGDSLRDALLPSQFARQLERELNAANKRISYLEEAVQDSIDACERDIGILEQRMANLKLAKEANP